jgi:hypothetical protein
MSSNIWFKIAGLSGASAVLLGAVGENFLNVIDFEYFFVRLCI